MDPAAATSAVAALGAVAAHDLIQRQHAILRNFPVVGHLRFQLERFGPELRQYIVTGNDEERPFSRDQRRWVYASSKLREQLLRLRHRQRHRERRGLPDHQAPDLHRPGRADGGARARGAPSLPSAKVLGGPRGRRHAFRPASVVNVSGMSFGALSGERDRGAQPRAPAMAGCLQNTGEGALSPYHRNGGDLVFQIGTGYFGCRDADGRLRPGQAQGPGRVGAGARHRDQALAGRQARPRRDAARGQGQQGDRRDPRHRAGRGLRVAEPAHGLPRRRLDARLRRDWSPTRPGCRSASSRRSATWSSGTTWSQHDGRDGRGVDFVNVDGGEGGTGAAPMIFADAVAYPFRLGFAAGLPPLRRRPGSPTTSRSSAPASSASRRTPIVAFALGADMVNVGREAMLSIGCIQAQKCHTDHCPVGVATQNPRYTRGLDPTLKSVRLANYVKTLRRDLLKVSEAVGVVHPALITPRRRRRARRVHRPGRCARSTATSPGGGVVGPAAAEEIAGADGATGHRNPTAADLSGAQEPRAGFTDFPCLRRGPSVSAVRKLSRPGGDVVAAHGLAHRPHPPGQLLLVGAVGLEQRGLHAVDVVGVDQPRLPQLVGGAGELREHQRPGVVVLRRRRTPWRPGSSRRGTA